MHICVGFRERLLLSAFINHTNKTCLLKPDTYVCAFIYPYTYKPVYVPVMLSINKAELACEEKHTDRKKYKEKRMYRAQQKRASDEQARNVQRNKYMLFYPIV